MRSGSSVIEQSPQETLVRFPVRRLDFLMLFPLEKLTSIRSGISEKGKDVMLYTTRCPMTIKVRDRKSINRVFRKRVPVRFVQEFRNAFNS